MPAPNFTPRYTGNKVVVAQGQLWVRNYTPSASAVPPTTSNPLGYDWSTIGTQGWTAVGATDTGVSFNFARKVQNIMVEEQQTPDYVLSDSTDVSLDVSLAQGGAQQLVWALGGGTITTGTGATPTVISINSALSQYSVALETVNDSGFARRFIFEPCVSVGTVKAEMRRASNKQMWTTSFVYTGPLESIWFNDLNA